jgi:hypothetical protein
VLESQRARRTKKQVEEDKSRAKAAAIEKEANQLSVLSTIAELEDTIEKNEEQVRVHTNRPDLHPTRKPLRNTMSEGPDSHKE